MSLDVVIRHARRERDVCALRLSEVRQRQTEAENDLRTAQQGVADAEQSLHVQGTQLTSATDLRQRFTNLSRRRQVADLAQQRLAEIEVSVADALDALIAGRQQLKMYEKVESRRAASARPRVPRAAGG